MNARRNPAARLLLFLCAAGSLAPADATAEPRPFLFGCGITWGNWLGLNANDAKEWDRRSMDKIVQMGGTNCPANFAWIDIEPVRGVRNWDYVDHQVNEARARGLEIFAYSGLTPDWALPPAILQQYGSGIGYRFPPDTPYIADFEDFFRTLAARYRGRVKYYEFWNEPNGCSWILDDCRNSEMAATYVPWLIRWYNAMKQGDPDCVLAVGGLDYSGSGVWRYLADIYMHGGGDAFDAVAIHPYGSPLNWQAIHDTGRLLRYHGDGHKKLWLNEYGWNTTNETAKATHVAAVLNEFKKPYYDMVFQANYLVITDLPETPDTGHDYGLCSRNRATLTITPRQSWYAFRDVNKSFPDEADFTADVTAGPLPLTVHFADRSHVAGATAWSWQFGDGGASHERNPTHTYTQDGAWTVRLTVTGSAGPTTVEKSGCIRAGIVPPMPGVANPSFEDGGGSYDGWEIVHVVGDLPDDPPRANDPYGLRTSFGTRFAGRVTQGDRLDFYVGQVVGVTNWHPSSPHANWELSAFVNLSSTHEGIPNEAGVRQTWEIGWNDDGSEPAGIMQCDRYQAVANLNGYYTGNDDMLFRPLRASGVITGVKGLRGVALRARLYTTGAWSKTQDNIDNLSLVIMAAPPVYPADLDHDSDVDVVDFALFQLCFAGPNRPPSGLCVVDADLDDDGDADLVDFGILQACFNGPNRTPKCD